MPKLYVPLAASDPRAPALVETYYPTGLDLDAVCAQAGWYRIPPDGVAVYAQDGTLLREAEPTPVTTPAEETTTAQPVRRSRKTKEAHHVAE